MVILVIGIVAAVMMPRIGGMLDRQALRKTTMAIRGMVRYASAKATLEKRVYRLTFDLEHQVISVCAFDRPQTREHEEESLGVSIVGPPIDASRRQLRPEEPVCREEFVTGLRAFEIPTTIRIMDVVSPRGEKTVEGEAATYFYRTGEADPSIIHLMTISDEKRTLWIEPFTGNLQEWEGYVEAKAG